MRASFNGHRSSWVASLGVLEIEEVSVLEVVEGIVPSKRVWCHFLVRVSEVDVAHVLFIEEHIWIQGVIVPEVMQVIFSFVMPQYHSPNPLGQSVGDVGPENGSHQIEPRIERSEYFVVRVVAESLVACQVREGVQERMNTVLQETESSEPEHRSSGDCVGSPLAVQVLLKSLMEDSVTTILQG